MSGPLQTTLTKMALSVLRKVTGFVGHIWPTIARAFSAIGKLLTRIFVLPGYRLAMNVKLRANRFSMPARGLLLLALSNRYLLHTVVLGLSIAVVAGNLAIRQANAQDVGQNSLLYALVTGDDSRVTEETVRPDLLVQDSHYAGPASLFAEADIDFDYDESAEPPLTAVSVPGTILADSLTPHDADEPAGPTAPRTGTETYVVQAGDTLSQIAQKFGVNVGTILWANSRTELQYLRPGDTLKIPATSGVLVTVKKGDTLLALAKKYGSDADEIIRVNRLVPDQPLPEGIELTLPGGKPVSAPIAYVPRTSTPVPGRVIGKDGIPRNPEVAPPVNYPKPADEDASDLPAGKLLWPTSGHVVTQYYGWKHTGVDIDGDYSSPIYASQDGTVTTAGWNSGGYGMQIVVTGGGVMTRYAHASKMFVKSGDEVKKGEVIAMVGTTGRSTGTHLHYEVYVNGKRVNPLTYIRK
jgi:murein DD-endopeptidase MepM/ murein hydrolase activator NlpD